MPPELGDPADWLAHARSDLALARGGRLPGVRLEALCFHAQQAAEKAMKAVLIASRVRFPYTHHLQTLLDLLPPEVPTNDDVRRAVVLTEFAVTTRYPAVLEPVDEHELETALRLAAACIDWAATLVASGP